MAHFYLRGVAPHEMHEALQGRDGRLPKTEFTNRGNERLAFGMNKMGHEGISDEIVDNFLIEAAYYANLGAYIEAHFHLPKEFQKNVNPDYRGYFLIFKTTEALKPHPLNEQMYGPKWETAVELPEGIERHLIGIVPASPMSNPGSMLPYQKGDSSILIEK